MTRVVSLPWYDLPLARQGLDAFWSALRDALHREGVERLPTQLDRMTPLGAQWSHPNLLLSQCCGLDLFTSATGAVTPVGRPVFALSCEPGDYFSYVVAAPGATLPPRRIVVNAVSSRSGCTALLAWLDERGWTPREVRVSGSHLASADMVRRGLADVASIDAHSWGLMGRGGLEVIGESAPAPTPPFVTCTRGDVPSAVLLRALGAAVVEAGDRIGIRKVLPADAETYRSLEDEVTLMQRVTQYAVK